MNNVVVKSATFEEAFGDFSEARGRGRARRKKRRLERIRNRREVRTERRKLKDDRQQERIARRANRKRARQQMRDEQQEARMGRRQRRIDMRQNRAEARQLRKDTKTQGEQGRENYVAEQEKYRNDLNPENEGGQDQGTQQGYEDQGGQNQGGQDQDAQQYFPQDEQQYAPSQENEIYAQDDTYDMGINDGAYGDDNSYENDYNQEEDEFNDNSYFNVEGMEGKVQISPYVKEKTQKLKNNLQAYNVLSEKRNRAIKNNDNTRGLDNLLQNVKRRCLELKSNLDDYCNADGNVEETRRRSLEVAKAMQRMKRRHKNLPFHTRVQSRLNPNIQPNRITIPPSSNFDAYSDLGRPIIVDGEEYESESGVSNYLYDNSAQPTTIEMQSSFEGDKKNNLLSLGIGVGVGVLALYFAKRKGWI